MTRSWNISIVLRVLHIVVLSKGCWASESVVEEVDFAEVRPGAHLFWLLQYTTHADGFQNRPWIIWIQGGPGVSGTAFGNYEMFGPEDTEGNPRPTTWVQSASIIYVDSPIDTGFSYIDVSYGKIFPNNTEEVSNDLVTFTKLFLQSHPVFRTMPLYIIGQSYGGKLAPAFAYYLNEAVLRNEIRCNLKGVALGNGYVSPLDSRVGRTEMAYQMSLMDESKYELAMQAINEFILADERNDVEGIYNALDKFHQQMGHHNPYNILEHPVFYQTDSMYRPDVWDAVYHKMNGAFHAKFNSSILPEVEYSKWGNFTLTDREQPVYRLIDELLHKSNVQVIVYSGQYDVICCTSGQLAWIRRLAWPGIADFHRKDRVALKSPDSEETEMYVKATEQFKFYWVLKSGHVVPRDVPKVGLRLLNRILDESDK